jgi:hypothetical protein
MVKKYKDWRHKSDISLFITKPTIVTYNFFYLKVNIFRDIIS